MSQQNRPQTMREVGSHAPRELPIWMLVLVNVTYAVPLIVLFLYCVGWMSFQKDSTDTTISSASVMTGLFGLAFINFVIKYLEDRR